MPAEKITDISRARRLCKGLGITLTAGNRPMRFGPTSRPATNAGHLIERLITRHGESHVWAVLAALTQAETARSDLTSAMIGAISDLFLANPDWAERLGAFMDALDPVDLGRLRKMASRGPGLDGGPPRRRILIAAYLQQLVEPAMRSPGEAIPEGARPAMPPNIRADTSPGISEQTRNSPHSCVSEGNTP